MLNSGGIAQTVTGQSFDSVFEPRMRVIVWCVQLDIYYPQAEQICDVINSTVMICPTSPLDTQNVPCLRDRRAVDESARDRRAVDENARDRRAVDESARERRAAGEIVKSKSRNIQLRRYFDASIVRMYSSFQFDDFNRYDNVSEALGELCS